MMLMPLLLGGAAFAMYAYLKLPKYERCPAGRRKYARKAQAEARRMLRDPKNRGDRASHRAARRLLRLTRKHNPSKPRFREPTPEEDKRDELIMSDLLAKWAFEKTEEMKAKVKAEAEAKGETVVYEDSDSMVTEGPAHAHKTDG